MRTSTWENMTYFWQFSSVQVDVQFVHNKLAKFVSVNFIGGTRQTNWYNRDIIWCGAIRCETNQPISLTADSYGFLYIYRRREKAKRENWVNFIVEEMKKNLKCSEFQHNDVQVEFFKIQPHGPVMLRGTWHHNDLLMLDLYLISGAIYMWLMCRLIRTTRNAYVHIISV